jgi:hypothetical protein
MPLSGTERTWYRSYRIAFQNELSQERWHMSFLRSEIRSANVSIEAYARRWVLITGLTLYFANVSTTVRGAEANVPSNEKLQLLPNFFEKTR